MNVLSIKVELTSSLKVSEVTLLFCLYFMLF